MFAKTAQTIRALDAMRGWTNSTRPILDPADALAALASRIAKNGADDLAQRASEMITRTHREITKARGNYLNETKNPFSRSVPQI